MKKASIDILNQNSEIPIMNRSSHLAGSVRKGILRNFVKFTGKHLCQSFFLNKVIGHFTLNFLKFLRAPFLHNTSGDCFYMNNEHWDCSAPKVDSLVEYRSNRSQMFFKIGILKTFVTFTGKHLSCSLF